MLGVLDLLGVIAIGLLGALSVYNRQDSQSKNLTSQVLDFLNLSNLSFQSQSLCLGLGAVILLVGRTILSIFFTRRILFGSKIGIRNLLVQSNRNLEERNTIHL